MYISESDISCGVAQGSTISDRPIDSTYEMGWALYGDPPKLLREYKTKPSYAMIMFSDTVVKSATRAKIKNSSPGVQLAKYLASQNIGTVVESPTKTNPNTSNPIKAWIFAPDEKLFRKWMWTKRRKEAYKPSDDYDSHEDYYMEEASYNPYW